MMPLVTQPPPWYFWLVFGLVHGALFGHFAQAFLRLWQQSKERKREEEQRRWDSLVANVDLPLSPAMRAAYEQGWWQGMLRNHMHEQSRNLRAVLDRLERIESKLDQKRS